MKGQNDLIQLMYSNKSNRILSYKLYRCQVPVSQYVCYKKYRLWVRSNFSVMSSVLIPCILFALRVLSFVFIVLDCMPVIHKESPLCSYLRAIS